MQLLSIYRASQLFKKTVCRVMKVGNSQMNKHVLKHNVRCLSSINNSTEEGVKSSKDVKWKPIYFFPQIQLARLLNRFKLYQTVFTVTCWPMSIGFYYLGKSDITTVMTVTGAATAACITLYVVTLFFKRLIGVIYCDETGKNLRIGHLTFWGNRKDITVPVDKVMPLIECNSNVSDAFVKLQRYDSNEILYFTLRFGKILDKDTFQEIFGSFEIFQQKK